MINHYSHPELDMNIPALTTDQMIEADRLMIEEYGIQLIQMMENAGRNCTDLIERWGWTRAKDRPLRVCIICGKGNNGGDGFVIARHLAHRGHRVTIDVTADPTTLTGDAAINHAIAEKMQLPIRRLTAATVTSLEATSTSVKTRLKGRPRSRQNPSSARARGRTQRRRARWP